MRLPASRAPARKQRQPASFRVLGKGSRTVGVFAAPGHLDDWKHRLSRAVETGAVQPETFVVVAIDALGVELSRREWTPSTKEAD